MYISRKEEEDKGGKTTAATKERRQEKIYFRVIYSQREKTARQSFTQGIHVTDTEETRNKDRRTNGSIAKESRVVHLKMA